MAGPKRPQDRVLLKDMKSAMAEGPVSAAFGKASPASPVPVKLNGDSASSYRRSRGDRRHHELHEYEQSVGDGRRRTARAERGQKGAQAEAVGEDEPRPGQPRRDRLPETRPASTSRSITLGFNLVGYGCTTCIGNSGPLPDAVSQGRQRRATSWPRPSFGQPQFRGADQSASEGELSRQSAAGRRLRAWPAPRTSIW